MTDADLDPSQEFFYDETCAKDGYCPSHVERLRKCLLDFSCPRPRGAFFKDWVELDSAPAETDDRNAVDPRLIPSYSIQQDAIRKASEKPPGWLEFYGEHFLKRPSSSVLHGTMNARMYNLCSFSRVASC